MDALELCNKINMEAESLADSGFPLEVFPQKMQSIIIDMVVHGNFKVDYVAMSMLSAASAALGNTYRIHVKQDWDTNAALYIILVGRPGMGKTPPLQLAYKPIREYERKLFDKFCYELDLYEAACATKESGSKEMKKPILKRVTLDDFTLEALVLEHYNNLRGIAINYDEILGLLANTDRYGKNPMLERLLSIWSGCHLENTRVKNDRPQRVEEPCVNIIGTTQTKRMKELMASKFMDTGFLDRILVVYPKSKKVPHWLDEEDSHVRQSEASRKWADIIGKIFGLDYARCNDTNECCPNILYMDKDAHSLFFGWWNRNVDAINAIEDDEDVETRVMKHNTHVARIALLLQALRYACGESHLQSIDVDSIKGALQLNEYCENCYQRCRAFVAEDTCDSMSKDLLYLLEDSFDTKTAIKTGMENLHVTDRTVMNYIKELMKSGLITKAKKGFYEKVKFETGQATET